MHQFIPHLPPAACDLSVLAEVQFAVILVSEFILQEPRVSATHRPLEAKKRTGWEKSLWLLPYWRADLERMVPTGSWSQLAVPARTKLSLRRMLMPLLKDISFSAVTLKHMAVHRETWLSSTRWIQMSWKSTPKTSAVTRIHHMWLGETSQWGFTFRVEFPPLPVF